MKLLLDAGNSRLKWGVHDGRGWLAQGAVAHDTIAGLAAQWAAWPIRAVHAASVARPEVAEAIEQAAPCAVQWVRATAAFADVRNHYRNPAEQGADRWLAVLAARSLCPGDVVVACAGTALTVEALTAEGDYLGGMILPGQQLMLRSLAQGTAQLDRLAGQVQAFPQGTADALASGVLAAQCGAIERMGRQLAAHTGRGLPPVLLTGGDAAVIAAQLAVPPRIVDNLVLMGLLRVACES
ncbi:type III pantothenate kinase [Aquitalea magnusonii]|uniref:Type III pantothenate kinase n=1 Tax=Aquitalea magnusonii TaxID=332411 RepID=A0A318JIS7_9NEIS|nr:type III pantothenate kinase [Aquitalea magnusonii]PXX43685.1 type III pantothenate kinase [Aquitalea magnusonii]